MGEEPANVTDELRREKLRLEIANLRRSPWKKPSVVVPLLAALITLGVSQYLGVFDVERKRIEVSAIETKNEQFKLQQDVKALETDKKSLSKDREALTQEKQQLEHQIAALQATLDYTKNVIAMPLIQLGQIFVPQRRQALVYVENKGQSPANILAMRAYTFNSPISPTPGRALLREVMKRFDIDEMWLHYQTPKFIKAGERIVILDVPDESFTPERGDKLREALQGNDFRLDACYCTALDKCFWASTRGTNRQVNSCDAN